MQKIVFVHGFMNNGQIWRQWVQWFTARGFKCYTPSWPYMDGNVTTLRKHPRPQLKNTRFNDVVNHYAQFQS